MTGTLLRVVVFPTDTGTIKVTSWLEVVAKRKMMIQCEDFMINNVIGIIKLQLNGNCLGYNLSQILKSIILFLLDDQPPYALAQLTAGVLNVVYVLSAPLVLPLVEELNVVLDVPLAQLLYHDGLGSYPLLAQPLLDARYDSRQRILHIDNLH